MVWRLRSPRRAGGAGAQYEVTRIAFRARSKKGRDEYTLDVGPPSGVASIPEVVAAERVRKARLEHLRRWWGGSPA